MAPAPDFQMPGGTFWIRHRVDLGVFGPDSTYVFPDRYDPQTWPARPAAGRLGYVDAVAIRGTTFQPCPGREGRGTREALGAGRPGFATRRCSSRSSAATSASAAST